MNKQEIFTKAYIGLRDQGFERSVTVDEHGDETCAYRGDNGLKCAIGHCIPDERYKPELEGDTPNHNPKLLGKALGFSLTPEDALWLTDLQRCHDSACSGSGVQRYLRRFAEKHGLEVPSDV